ncbi:MAG: YceI family protein [Candidatus Marinimicrobia bacterium]|nr:YceI family protein [Candidatus Neomarinimicrobiota bacterium]
MKGITHPISFYSKIQKNNEILLAKSKITFDRSLYNVKFGSGKFFQNLGNKLIYDDIEVEVLLKTKQIN